MKASIPLTIYKNESILLAIYMNNELRIRNTSADICGLFENILTRFNITIPDENRTGDESEARIYGDEYSNLEDDITEILSELCNKIKSDPDVKINTEEY